MMTVTQMCNSSAKQSVTLHITLYVKYVTNTVVRTCITYNIFIINLLIQLYMLALKKWHATCYQGEGA